MLHLHRAESAGTLVPALAEVLSEPHPDPMRPRVVAVAARGVERWLSQRLSHHLGAGPDQDGICANVLMPSPRDLVDDLIAGCCGPEDPWAGDGLAWHVLGRLTDCADEPWLADVRDHLGLGTGPDDPRHQTRRGRRYAFAFRTARRFHAYAAQRPAMLRAWAAGRDEDGTGQALPGHQQWQPPLWRAVRDTLDGPDPVQRLDHTVQALSGADPDNTDPVCVFGPSRLDERDLLVLLAHARTRHVHLFLPHPSPVLWDRITAAVQASDQAPADPRPAGTGLDPRAPDPTAALVHNPVLRSLSVETRQFQYRLLTGPGATPVTDRYHLPGPGTGRAPGVLGRLQHLLAADLDPGDLPAQADPAAAGPGPGPTISVHACHGPTRQVEVLRELVTGLLADDDTLEPRDILIMCPQIETFAPLLEAAFADPAEDPGDTGPGEPDGSHPGRRLRVRLADRGLRRTNPVLQVLATVLDLATSRATSSEILALLGQEPVSRRFQLDPDDLTTIREWVQQAHVRWGLTGADRLRFGVPDLAENTWHVGLDRILLGVTMDTVGHRARLGGLPLDGIDSRDADRAGRLNEFVHRLAMILRAMTGEHPPTHWQDLLTRAVDTLTLTRGRDAWQQTQARAIVQDAFDTRRAAAPPLALADIVALLEDRLAARPTRASFRTGDLTVCSLVPMRSVPHRVVVLLGMDTGMFPRDVAVDGDDVLAGTTHPGELDPAAHERQILLDTLCSARERVIVLYAGAHERTGVARPPAAPIGDLLDLVRDIDPSITEHRHPLLAFDAREFTPGEFTPGAAFSFDAVARQGALARRGPRRPVREDWVSTPLPPLDEPVIALADLAAFYADPAKVFAQRRLGLPTFEPDLTVPTQVPLEPNHLDTWRVTDGLLRSLRAGLSPEEAAAAERRRGLLPPGTAGDGVLRDCLARAETILRLSGPVLAGPPGHHPIDLGLPGGRRLVGTVQPLHGKVLAQVQAARAGTGHMMQLWVPLLALVHQTGDPTWCAGLVAGGGDRSRWQLPDPDTARTALQTLVRWYDIGLTEPLPLPPRTVSAVLEHSHRPLDRAWTRAGKKVTTELAAGPWYARLRPWAQAEELPTVQPLSPQVAADLPANPLGWFGVLLQDVWQTVVACRTSG